MKDTIVSGIRATGKLHIGNYLGALRQFVNLQNEDKITGYFFIADLHALSTPFEPKELTENTYDVVAEYLAAGIDPKKSIFFLQNQVQEHAELAWIFNCITPLGELERMTQFKDKSKQHKTSINAGLLTYPALMAADILLYKPTAVPVGDDQVQHIELTRTIARKFNSRFGKTFPEPRPYETKPLRILSLKDPNKKMSKTGDDPLYLSDSPDEIMKKMKKAVTATEGQDHSPGTDNLFVLLDHFGTDEQNKYFVNQRDSNSLKFSELKETLARNIAQNFDSFIDKKQKLLTDRKHLDELLAEGAAKARKAAQLTLNEVKGKIGLV
ncbi:MAG: tryptophan--tRNA ligase [Candidatus Doudnabacteria bacterium]|nr:tryptophan--tRNA ligase [Candidatus Doudnabacteria bacterium]